MIHDKSRTTYFTALEAIKMAGRRVLLNSGATLIVESIVRVGESQYMVEVRNGDRKHLVSKSCRNGLYVDRVVES